MFHRPAFFLGCAVVLVTLAGCGGSPPTIGSSPTATGMMQSRSVAAEDDFRQWDEYKKNPIVGPNTNAAFPFVLQQDGRFLMWTDNDAWGGVFFQTSDDGKVWSTAVPCSGLAAGARHLRVLFNPTLAAYEAWYWDGGDDFSLGAFHRATSTNGVNWSNDRTCAGAAYPHRPVYAIIWGPGFGSQGPSQVFYNASGAASVNYDDVWQNRYVMYYHVMRMADNKDCLGLAVSADGLTWGVPVEGKVVLDVGAAGAWDSKAATFGTILRDGSGFRMFYAGGKRYFRYGGDGIGYATSPDGLVWAKAPEPVLSIADNVAWRSYYIGPASLIVADVRMLYLYAYDGGARYSVGLFMPDLTPPVIALNTPSDTVLSPANGKTIPITLTGSAFDEGVGVASASLTVEDEYGVVNQTIDLTGSLNSATGAFTQVVELVASCNSTDTDGHQYRIVLNAADRRRNVANPVAVTVVAGRPSLQDPVGPGNGAGNGNGYGIGNGNGPHKK